MLFLCCLAAVQPAAAAVDETALHVAHRVDFPHREAQYVRIRSVFPVNGKRTELSIPAWTPGSYLIRDYAAQVENLRVIGGSGRPLEARKVSKNSWLLETAEESSFSATYDVWAGELNVATSWVETSVALLNGATLFMYTDFTLDLPQYVQVQLPPDWPDLHTPLRPQEAPGNFLADDFDELVDSPILAGDTVSYDFSGEEQEYGLVFFGAGPFWDGEKARDDVARIVETQQAFWELNPFDRKFLFMNLFIGPFGGLEHDHCTVLMGDPLAMRDRKDYIKWLGLVSHEFFHAWNVRRMRPSSLAKYDYGREMYTRELWLAEGLSSYYDNLLLLRAGVIQVPEYLDLLATEIRNFETTPGREIRSAELASFDTWIKQYKQNENSINSTISYYRKGALIGFVTDMAIRRQTDGKASLDTVMRLMYQRYNSPGQGGYPPAEFEKTVGEIAGAEVRAMVQVMLRTTEDPPVDEALAWYGLMLDRSAEAGVAGADGRHALGGFGVVWEESGQQLKLAQVVRGHSGADAGLLPGDEVLAIGGQRVTPENYIAVLNRLQPGERVELTLARHGRLLSLTADVQEAIPEAYRIVPDPDIRNREKKRMEAWLGLEVIITKS